MKYINLILISLILGGFIVGCGSDNKTGTGGAVDSNPQDTNLTGDICIELITKIRSNSFATWAPYRQSYNYQIFQGIMYGSRSYSYSGNLNRESISITPRTIDTDIDYNFHCSGSACPADDEPFDFLYFELGLTETAILGNLENVVNNFDVTTGGGGCEKIGTSTYRITERHDNGTPRRYVDINFGYPNFANPVMYVGYYGFGYQMY